MDEYKKSILGTIIGVGLITLLGGALVAYTLVAAAGGPRPVEVVAEAPAPQANDAAPESNAPPAASENQGDAEAGKKVFVTCSACHGPDGKGIPGLGKDLTNSEFVKGLTDDELVDFIKVGRDPSDPANTTGVGMPPKGGNPALSDQDLYDVVAYIRTLQQ